MASRAPQPHSQLRATTPRQVEGELATLLFRSGFAFLKRHPVLTGTYVLGLVLFQFFAGVAVSAAARQQFETAVGSIDIAKYDSLREEAFAAEEAYRASKGWFFTCDERCTQLYEEFQHAKARQMAGDSEYDAKLSLARAHVGIFSEYGVQDVRDKFWEAYYGGAGFAKRMSYFDALTMSIGAMRRDESLISVLLNWLLSAALNFTFAMITTLFSFAMHLGGLIVSYQASPISGLGFFALAMVGATSVLGTFVLGIYLAAASTAYVAVKTLGPNLRIEFNEAQGGRRRFIRTEGHETPPHNE